MAHVDIIGFCVASLVFFLEASKCHVMCVGKSGHFIIFWFWHRFCVIQTSIPMCQRSFVWFHVWFWVVLYFFSVQHRKWAGYPWAMDIMEILLREKKVSRFTLSSPTYQWNGLKKSKFKFNMLTGIRMIIVYLRTFTYTWINHRTKCIYSCMKI